MIATLIIWLYTVILMYLYGLAAINGLRHILHINEGDEINFPLALLIGLMVLTVSASILNIFIPLGIVSAGILLAGGLLILFSRRSLIPVNFNYRTYHPLTWILLASIFLTVLENATHVPSSSDTALYHAQTIRWFETYHTVPGLGNLHHRFAFNSSWLLLNAAFSFAFLEIRSFHLMSGVLFLSAALFFAEGVEALIQKNLSVSIFIKILFLPLSFYLLGSDISSPATDMPVTLLTWVILILWAEELEAQSRVGLRSIGIFLLSVFAVTIKLSAIPLLFFAIFVLIAYFIEAGWQRALKLGAAGLFVLIPWVIRSVILSGYLVFPVSQIDLFSVDWKVPIDQVETIRNAIFSFARFPGKDWQSSIGMTTAEWVPLWFDKQTINQRGVFMLAAFSPLILLIVRYKYPSMVPSRYVFSCFVLYAGAIFWFFSAPDIRFGYGFLVGICGLVLSPLFVDLISRSDKNLKLIPYIVFLVLVLYQGYTFGQSFDPRTLGQRLLLPADYSRSRAQVCAIDNGSVYCRMEGTQCNYDIFPCIPSPRPNVEMRGPTFQDGFRTVR